MSVANVFSFKSLHTTPPTYCQQFLNIRWYTIRNWRQQINNCTKMIGYKPWFMQGILQAICVLKQRECWRHRSSRMWQCHWASSFWCFKGLWWCHLQGLAIERTAAWGGGVTSRCPEVRGCQKVWHLEEPHWDELKVV